MSSGLRRKSESGIDSQDRNKVLTSDKKLELNDQGKGDRPNDISKLDIGEHYMVKRGDMWRE